MRQSLNHLFDKIAPTYDRLNHLFSMQSDRWWRLRAARSLALSDTARVLDVCTGTADVALAVARRYPQARIYGVDVSQAMLRHSQAKIARQQHQRADALARTIALARADALALPFPAHTFEAAFLGFGLRNLSDRRAGLQEVYRVLQPDGCLVILEFAPPPDTLFGRVFRWYLGRIMPVIGGLVSKSPDAYRYLRTSIEHFPQPAVIRELLQEAHFHVLACQRIMGGIVYLYTAGKRPSPPRLISKNAQAASDCGANYLTRP